MATFHWYGGWTGNTGFNSGFSTNGLVGPSAQSLWTSVFTGFSTDKGDYAFGPYYWGFIENWREKSTVGGITRIDFATRLPRGGDTIFIGPASGNVTGPGHTHKIPVSLLFGGLTNGTSWLGSTAGTTGSFKHNPCDIFVQGNFGRKPNQIYTDSAGYYPHPNFDQPSSGASSAGYNYTELPYVKFDQPGSSDEFFKNSSGFFVSGPSGTSGFYIQYRDRAPRIGAGVYWDPFPLYTQGSNTQGGLTATSATPWSEESGVPRRYRASLHIGSIGFDNGEPIDIYGRGGLSTKRVMQGALEGIQTYPGITSTFCTLPLNLVNGINIKTTVRSSGCSILRTLTMDPYSLYSSDAPTNITAAAVSQLPKSTIFGVLVNEDNISSNTITFNSPYFTTTDAAVVGYNTSIRKAVINQRLDLIGGVGTANDISVTLSGGGCNGGKVGMAVFLPDEWNITQISNQQISLNTPFTLPPWHACFVSYTQPQDSVLGNVIHYRQAKLDDITSGLTAFTAKASVSDNWYGSAHLSFFVNESDTPKLLRIPTGVTHSPTPSTPDGCGGVYPTAKAIFLIGRNESSSLPIALTGDSGGLSADSNGLDPIDIMGNGGNFYFYQSGADGGIQNHNAKVAIRSVGLTNGTSVFTSGSVSSSTGPDSANLKFAGKISSLGVHMGGFEALSFEGVETNFSVPGPAIFCTENLSKFVLNENTNEAESGINSVIIYYKSNKLSEVTIPCSVIGELNITYRGSTAQSQLSPSQTPNISIGSRSGSGVKTYGYVNVSLDYPVTVTGSDPISTGDVLKVYSAQIDYLNLKSGTISPANDSLPIGIYPIFREGVIQNGRILTNIPSNPNWNNSLIGFSPSDNGLKISDSNARLGERDKHSILFSPGMNIKTTPGDLYSGLT